MSVEALWTMHFESLSGPRHSAGVVVFETGRIFGGDSCYYYAGNYEIDRDVITGNVESVRFNNTENCTSIIGPYNRLVFSFRGELESDGQCIRAVLSAGDRGEIRATLTRRRDLP
ncbi:hypothetical protein ACQAYK_08985 [Acidithiobacillus sp. AC3]